ncbi:MAG: DUF4886 domain-containing protein [Clostridia bacterium]|nr:DUF4886 domain-containing protein [Clostridia bacterium]
MKEKIYLLSIGNSFSQDAHRYLHELAVSQGIELETVNLYIGGCSLERHCNNIVSDANDYLLEVNGYSTEKYISVSEALKMHKWDFISLQQVSGYSGVPQSYFPYLCEIAEYIKKHCSDAQLIFHQTWAYEKDSEHGHFIFYNRDQHEMFRRLRDCSEMAAKILNVDIIRVGEAIQKLRDDVEEFDYPESGISLNRDGFHLSLDYGRFAAAAVWLKKLTGITEIDVNKFTLLYPDYEFNAELLDTIVKNI